MKFSVLLPTRNRLELLKYAVTSVLQQNEEDLEIIISDNYSDEDISGYIHSLNDKRIKYFRTDSFVSVTENWNNALNNSSGEWIVMLGDDDCLMKGYFSTMRQLIEQFHNPDFIYTHGFLFAYPNVLPGHPQGYIRTSSNAPFVINQPEPFLLHKAEALNLVKETFNFRCVFTFNMQYALVNKSFIVKMKREGQFYHSPYPDYYAMTSMMLLGERIVACPHPLVGVGISSKSYGYYHFNNLEEKGIDFLNNSHLQEVSQALSKEIFPGSQMNTSWLLSLEAIQNNFQEQFLKINFKRYRYLQIVSCLETFLKRTQSNQLQFSSFWKKLSFKEKCLYGIPFRTFSLFPFIFRKKFVGLLHRIGKSHIPYPFKRLHSQFENIEDFFHGVDPFNFAAHTHD